MISQPLLSTTQLGSVLQAARKSLGLSQEELGARVGLSQSRLSYLEKNPGQFSVDQLLAVCTALELEISIGLLSAASAAAPKIGPEAW